ncbi:MAG: hypothetical protein R3F34_14765 [Planctomycetota bacterium]
MQMQADLAAVTVRRRAAVVATARGAAVLAGPGAGLFDRADRAAPVVEREFAPSLAEDERRARLAAWRDAVSRTLSRRVDPRRRDA